MRAPRQQLSFVDAMTCPLLPQRLAFGSHSPHYVGTLTVNAVAEPHMHAYAVGLVKHISIHPSPGWLQREPLTSRRAWIQGMLEQPCSGTPGGIGPSIHARFLLFLPVRS